MRPTTWLPLAVLGLLVALTLWLNQLVRAPAARDDGTLRHDPDAIVEKFDAKKFGVDGRVLYTLAAKKMVHYPDDDSALLETLTLEAFEPRQFIAQEDTVVVLGSYRGTARETGRRFATEWAQVFTLREGKVTKFREYADTANMADAARKSTVQA